MRTSGPALAIALFAATAATAATTINNSNKFAYGANIGWINWQADTNNGAVIGQFYCTGFVYSANCGWIHLGGKPTNGFQYSNLSAADFGVNVLSNGSLRGFAYGANIGWINFETNGNPRVNLLTGAFDGYAYGANVGWISLSNAFAFVKTDTLDAGPDTDGDGIPDAWELSKVGNLTNLTAAGDFDSDGVPDKDEYLGDTSPGDLTKYLRITAEAVLGSGATNRLVWPSEPTRVYAIERSFDTTNGAAWNDSGLGVFSPDAGTNTTKDVADGSGATARFHRVRAIVPLAP